LAALNEEQIWRDITTGQEYGYYYLVTTKGDEVNVLSSIDALVAFFAPVDTAGEAALLVTNQFGRIHCDQPNVSQTSAGWEVGVETGTDCGSGKGIFGNRVQVSTDGEVKVLESQLIRAANPACVNGRRPEGYTLDATELNGLGATFSSIAQLEAASVFAFERLASELQSHSAPDSLVDEAKRSAWDEVKHARVMKAIAARFGGKVEMPSVGSLPTRSLFEIALENAVEGCVRETFGALQAMHQANHASDPHIAEAMRVIAEDETRHAALAWDIAAWVEPQLSQEQLNELRIARDAAVSVLESELQHPPSDEAVSLAGFPKREQALSMLGAVRQELWAA